MPLSEDDVELIEAFRAYIEDFVAADDRYGPSSRVSSDDESITACRFEAGPSSWFEVAVHHTTPQVRVGFLTMDTSVGDEVEQAIQDAGGTLNGYVGGGFVDAGLDWPDPPVEQLHEPGEYSYFATPLEIDDFGDLDFADIRGKVVRMLEGYLIAFGPEIALEAEDEE
jgi:hypothetical protein